MKIDSFPWPCLDQATGTSIEYLQLVFKYLVLGLTFVEVFRSNFDPSNGKESKSSSQSRASGLSAVTTGQSCSACAFWRSPAAFWPWPRVSARPSHTPKHTRTQWVHRLFAIRLGRASVQSTATVLVRVLSTISACACFSTTTQHYA